MKYTEQDLFEEMTKGYAKTAHITEEQVPDSPEAHAAMDSFITDLRDNMTTWVCNLPVFYNESDQIPMGLDDTIMKIHRNGDRTEFKCDAVKSISKDAGSKAYMSIYLESYRKPLVIICEFVNVKWWCGLTNFKIKAYAHKYQVPQPVYSTVHGETSDFATFESEIPGIIADLQTGPELTPKLMMELESRTSFLIPIKKYAPSLHGNGVDMTLLTYDMTYDEPPGCLVDIAYAFSVSFMFDGVEIELSDEYVSGLAKYFAKMMLHYNPIAVSAAATTGEDYVRSRVYNTAFSVDAVPPQPGGPLQMFTDYVFVGMPYMTVHKRGNSVFDDDAAKDDDEFDGKVEDDEDDKNDVFVYRP